MSRYAVGFMDEYDYKLLVEIVEADSELEAAKLHSKVSIINYNTEFKTLAQLQEALVKYDEHVGVKEIPS